MIKVIDKITPDWLPRLIIRREMEVIYVYASGPVWVITFWTGSEPEIIAYCVV